jgi:shikimate dehydrogenase
MTDRYAVIGNPISHSKSPLIHSRFAQSTGQDLEYTLIQSPLDGFARTLLAFRDGGGCGVNVTTPFKRQAFELADLLSERAQLAGAVNAIKFEGGQIHADNFDGIGLVNDIQRNRGVALAGKRVLILGAGGAARGALLPFLHQRPALLAIANHNVAKAELLAEQLNGHGEIVTGDYADFQNQTFDVVVNATSASLKGELPPLSPQVFGTDCLAYELVYGKGMTPFLRLASNAGVKRLADGVGMLIEQAAEAFFWWRGVRPGSASVITLLTVPLE